MQAAARSVAKQLLAADRPLAEVRREEELLLRACQHALRCVLHSRMGHVHRPPMSHPCLPFPSPLCLCSSPPPPKKKAEATPRSTPPFFNIPLHGTPSGHALLPYSSCRLTNHPFCPPTCVLRATPPSRTCFWTSKRRCWRRARRCCRWEASGGEGRAARGNTAWCVGLRLRAGKRLLPPACRYLQRLPQDKCVPPPLACPPTACRSERSATCHGWAAWGCLPPPPRRCCRRCCAMPGRCSRLGPACRRAG